MLVDYLENAAEFLQKKDAILKKLEEHYRTIYDRDIKREVILVKLEIRKKQSEITNELLLNLEEFRYLKKYFPDLLTAFMDDPYIGKFIKKKEWLLNYKPVDPKTASIELSKLNSKRAELKDAKKFLGKWIGSVNSRSFCATFPVLKGSFEGSLEKDEVITIIEGLDKKLIKEGWLLLITDSLITIPLAKFSNKLTSLRFDEMSARADMNNSRGKGTTLEANSIRKFEKIKRQADHYENVIIQLLLANPKYLKSLKNSKDWLSKTKLNKIEKIANRVTPRSVKERAWLNEMNKKIKDS